MSTDAREGLRLVMAASRGDRIEMKLALIEWILDPDAADREFAELLKEEGQS